MIASNCDSIAPIYTTATYSNRVRQRFGLGRRRTGAGGPDIFRQVNHLWNDCFYTFPRLAAAPQRLRRDLKSLPISGVAVLPVEKISRIDLYNSFVAADAVNVIVLVAGFAVIHSDHST